MQEIIKAELSSISQCMALLKAESSSIEKAVSICINSLNFGGKIIFCGNGGSAAQAQHLAAELVGRYKLERRAMAALSLTVDTSNITAIGNDYGYDDIFRRQLEGLGRTGDVLIGLSTSGNSRNVVLAFELAREMGVTTVALTGEGSGKMKELADICIAVPSRETNHIQEMHIAVGHILCGLVEKQITMRADYA